MQIRFGHPCSKQAFVVVSAMSALELPVRSRRLLASVAQSAASRDDANKRAMSAGSCNGGSLLLPHAHTSDRIWDPQPVPLAPLAEMRQERLLVERLAHSHHHKA